MGPKKDIVGLFRQGRAEAGAEIRRERAPGMELLWWTVSHGSDKTGPLAGVPYDGADPQYADLYHDYPKEFSWFSPSKTTSPPDSPLHSHGGSTISLD